MSGMWFSHSGAAFGVFSAAALMEVVIGRAAAAAAVGFVTTCVKCFVSKMVVVVL